MKRTVVALLLAAIGIMLLPVASASAAEARKCSFEGKVTFPEGGELGAPPRQLKYKFDSEAIGGIVGNKCTEGTGTVGASAEVHGEGKLSCAASNGLIKVGGEVKGEGTIKVGAKTYKITVFVFVGATAVVTFKAEGENEAKTEKIEAAGSANFAKNAAVLTKCAEGEGKVTSLLFEAEANALITP